jgi:hypothetical protein
MRAVDDRSFVWAAPLRTCWPLPLVMRREERSDLLYWFSFTKGTNERSGLALLTTALAVAQYKGMFFAAVRLMSTH